MAPRGVYWERKGWGTQDSVLVDYGASQMMDISEEKYRKDGYQPPSMTCHGKKRSRRVNPRPSPFREAFCL